MAVVISWPLNNSQLLSLETRKVAVVFGALTRVILMAEAMHLLFKSQFDQTTEIQADLKKWRKQ